MTYEQLQPIAPYIAATIFGLAIIAFVIAVRYFRKSRTDFYWRRRRAAGQRGWRLFLWSITLSFVSGLVCIVTGVAGLLNSRTTPTYTYITPTVISVAQQPTSTALDMIATVNATDAATATDTDTSVPASATTVAPTTAAATIAATVAATDIAALLSTSDQSALPTNGTDGVSAAALLATTAASASPIPSATVLASATTAPPSATSSQTRQTPSAAVSSTLAPSPTAATWTPTGPTRTQIPTSTPSLFPSKTGPATATATATVSPTETATATDTLVPALLNTVSLESSVTPSSNAALQIMAIDTQVTSDGAPVNPATKFKAGFNRIFFFINFSGMQSGILWRRDLLYNGQVAQSDSYLWGMAEEGSAFFFFGQEGGFKAGKYEIRLYIGQASAPTATFAFTVS